MPGGRNCFQESSEQFLLAPISTSTVLSLFPLEVTVKGTSPIFSVSFSFSYYSQSFPHILVYIESDNRNYFLQRRKLIEVKWDAGLRLAHSHLKICLWLPMSTQMSSESYPFKFPHSRTLLFLTTISLHQPETALEAGEVLSIFVYSGPSTCALALQSVVSSEP